jgi:hypothetical protein
MVMNYRWGYSRTAYHGITAVLNLVLLFVFTCSDCSQKPLKIKSLYLTHYFSYLTSNTTRVFQQQ